MKKMKGMEPEVKIAITLGCFLLTATLSFIFPFPCRPIPQPVLSTTDHHGSSAGRSSGSPPSLIRRGEEMKMKKGYCDLFDGHWVFDDDESNYYPLYHSKDCPFLDQGFRCSENGRPDSLYTKWRWQPETCNLPRFDAEVMLEKLRNKRLVFAGDSIGRNQWESLLCMLSSAVADKTSVYELNGNPITKHRGSLAFKFRDYNSTVEYYRSPFLVLHGRAPPGVPEEVATTIKLDAMDFMSEQWKDADVLIFNTGHFHC